MQYALVGGVRQRASPDARGICPQCENPVIARCGDVMVWHWAHVSCFDCDSWSEGETPWHVGWKGRFPKQWREVTMGWHRADIKAPQAVIELQASSISPDEIREREHFYGEMVWVLDASRFNLDIRDRGSYVTFRWKYPHKTWWEASRQLIFDLGDALLTVRNLYPNMPCGGSGELVSYEAFVQSYSRVRPGHALCCECRMQFTKRDLKETGMYEYLKLDLDCGELICCDCYERLCDDRTPDDPSLFDVLTPVYCAKTF
jgi:competence protein CoiA